LLFNCRCHKTPEETMTHDPFFQLPTSQTFLAIGSFESGFQGNPNGGLQTCDCYHHVHPRHKYLEWFPPELDQTIFWVILDLKMKRKKTLFRDKLFWICLAYLQSRWDYLLSGQSILWSLRASLLLPQFQSSSLQVGEWNRHGIFLLKSSWVQV